MISFLLSSVHYIRFNFAIEANYSSAFYIFCINRNLCYEDVAYKDTRHFIIYQYFWTNLKIIMDYISEAEFNKSKNDLSSITFLYIFTCFTYFNDFAIVAVLHYCWLKLFFGIINIFLTPQGKHTLNY